jgi:hypothetical protein
MPPPDEHPDRGPQQVTTSVVIPYFAGDIGRPGVERPIAPGQAVSWLCNAIVVDGIPGNSAFRRGVPIRVAVDVANWGAGALPAIVLVRLWWSDPTLSFAAATLFAQTSVPVLPTGQPRRVGDFIVTIPPAASPHVCLLAQVSAPLDGASGVPDPNGDRHWAQLNLVEATPQADGTFAVPFVLANPFPMTMRGRLSVGAMSDLALRQISDQRGVEVRTADGLEVDFRDDGLVDLPAQTSRLTTARMRLPAQPAPGERYGCVLTQRLWQDGDAQERVHQGSLGVLLAGR